MFDAFDRCVNGSDVLHVLRDLGIKTGKRRDSVECPLARYFRGKLPAASLVLVGVDEVTVFGLNGGTQEHEMPHALQEFIHLWDS